MKELLEIQSALDNEAIVKNELIYETDEPSGNVPTFKKPFTCNKCGKIFISKSKLDCHERIHKVCKLNCNGPSSLLLGSAFSSNDDMLQQCHPMSVYYQSFPCFLYPTCIDLS